jgi:hypothetical protein
MKGSTWVSEGLTLTSGDPTMTPEKRVKRIARSQVGQPPPKRIETPKTRKHPKYKARMEDE